MSKKMGKIMRSLIKAQRQINRHAVGGDNWIHSKSDRDLAEHLRYYYQHCPYCRQRLDWLVDRWLRKAESHDHFIVVYGRTLQRHYADNPDCEAQARRLEEDPYLEKNVDKWQAELHQNPNRERWHAELDAETEE